MHTLSQANANLPTVGRVTDPGAYRIDRGTPLGNPFVMRSEAERPAVCQAFRVLLWRLHKYNFNVPTRALAKTIADDMGLLLSDRYSPTGEQIYKAIKFLLSPQGQNRKLGCHCSPRECHGDTIVRYLRWLLTDEAAMFKFTSGQVLRTSK